MTTKCRIRQKRKLRIQFLFTMSGKANRADVFCDVDGAVELDDADVVVEGAPVEALVRPPITHLAHLAGGLVDVALVVAPQHDLHAALGHAEGRSNVGKCIYFLMCGSFSCVLLGKTI